MKRKKKDYCKFNKNSFLRISLNNSRIKLQNKYKDKGLIKYKLWMIFLKEVIAR